MRIAILGAGAWGSALAIALARHHEIVLWARDAQLACALGREGENRRYLPGYRFPVQVRVTAAMDEALEAVELLLVATPVAGLRETLAQLRGRALPAGLIWACKGLDSAPGAFAHEIVRDELGDRVPGGVLSGPSFAAEVAAGLPAALTLACADLATARRLAGALTDRRLRLYASDDVIGVELAGALKNVLAIASGISDGLGFGLNARAALVTRGLAEIARLGLALGGRRETFMGLAGMGDVILTCTGDLSRNRRVGLALARGEPLPAVLGALGHVAEGVRTARAACELAQRHAIDMPISLAVASVLFEGLAPGLAVERLLARDAKAELD
ncbi:MAG: NAD(P)H-dependent glycerol-3-phosphate dehydrogenase [Rhodocyclaceae bacterium]